MKTAECPVCSGDGEILATELPTANMINEASEMCEAIEEFFHAIHTKDGNLRQNYEAALKRMSNAAIRARGKVPGGVT